MKLMVFINVDWYCALHWQDRLYHWKSLGIDTHVLTNFMDPSIRQRFQSVGIQCHDIKFKRKSLDPIGTLRAIWKFHNLIKEIKPDLVHTITLKPNIIGGLVASFYKKPLLLSVTGLGVTFDDNASLKFRLVRRLILFFYTIISYRKTHHFIFENMNDRAVLIASGAITEKNSSIVNGAGIDIKKYYPTEKPLGKNVLLASRLIWSKGLKDLIEAKKIASGTEKDFNLLIAGIVDKDVNNAIPLSYIELAEKEGLITWLGEVNDMPKLFTSIDLAVLPSTYKEGIPRFLIEAASCGKPLVATDIPGCNEIVRNGKNGLLVPINNPEALLCSINQILSNPELHRKFSIASRELVKNKYTDTIVYNQFLSLFRTLINSKTI